MNRVSLALAILAAITVSGCAGSGGTSVTPPSSYVLNPNVVELDKTTATVDSVTTDTVVLKNAPSLSKDQIIIHNALDDKRFLRKVISTSTSGSSTTVKTADAGVEDVFKSAAISQQAPISATDLLKLKPAQAGITFTPATGGRGRAPSSDGVAINFSNLLLKADNGTPIVQLDGTLNLSAGIETKLDKSGLSVDQFLVAPYLDANGTLTARGRTDGSFVKEFPISLNLQIPVTPLGPLGVNCGVQLMMRVEGSYSAEGQFTVKASVHAKEGLQYTKAQGWSLIHEFDKSFDLTPPAFRGALEMGVSLIRPKIGVDILGIGEAHVTADAVKVVARLTAQTTPVAGFFVEAQGDFGFTLGGTVRLGPITLWNESRDFKLARFDIIKPFLLGNYGAGDTMIVYADLALRNLRAMNGDGTGDHVVATSTSAIYAPNVCNANGRICFGKFNAQGKGELWMATNTGGDAQRLTNGALSINHPVWNPTGTEIAFDATDTKQVKQIYVYNLAQNNIRQLTKDATASRIPTWSADGRWIYFEAATTFGTKVVAKTSASTSTYDVILANDTTTYGEPSLSPDGFHLVALRGGSEIVISDEQGRNERVILADPHLSRPTFSPDGLRVLLQYNDVGTAQVRSYDLSGRDEKIYATGMQPSWGLRH